MNPDHKGHFYDHPIEYPINNLQLPFAEYIKKNKEILDEYRVDLDPTDNFILESNIPFELRPDTSKKCQRGALLIHGLLDSPFIMKDIGQQLCGNGMLVRSILLPGHGTVPGSLLNVQYEDWLQTVRYGIATLKNEVDEIILVGYSTGAILSLLHTLQNPEKIAGIIMFSPAFKINSTFDFMTNWYKLIGWIHWRMHWLSIDTPIDCVKYSALPANAVYQVYRLTKALKKFNHHREPPCPIFIALSADDRIVKSSATIRIFQKYRHRKNKMIVYSPTSLTFEDKRIIQRCSAYPQWNITSFSHISIPVAPNNPYYGIHGKYECASHVEEKNNVIYGALDRPQKLFFDALYRLGLMKYRRERLTFNPDFDFMKQEIIQWISHLT